MPNMTLQALIEQLPEIYHPIFGWPETGSSRQGHEARVSLLLGQVEMLSNYIGRPLRILDLGSAQGYLTFRLAEVGHQVTGIDSLPINILVARAIHQLHPDLDVSFHEGDVLEVVEKVEAGAYDMVVGFSVLHHIVHRDGGAAGARLVAELAARVPHGFFEMALSSEPVYWAEALPADPRATLAGFAFIRQVGNSPTHLSEIERPVFFCSQSLALVNKSLYPILSYADKPHPGGDPTYRGVRRYYLLPVGIAKVVARFAAELPDQLIAGRRQELRREAQALEAMKRARLDVPELIEFVDTVTDTVLVRTAYQGILLSEAVELLNDAERALVTTQVLDALAALEAHGLYHRDLRLWNVIWDSQARVAHLIDHGSIGTSSDDTMWPFDAHFALLTFLGALWGRRADQTGLEIPRSSHLDSAELGRSAAELVAELLVHAQDDHVFRDLSAAWMEIAGRDAGRIWPPIPLAWEWLTKVETQREEMRRARAAGIVEKAQVVAALQAECQEERARCEQEAAERNREYGRLVAEREAELRGLEAQHRAEREAEVERRDARQRERFAERDGEVLRLQQERDELADTLQLIHGSRTWRLMGLVRRARSARARLHR